jgi:hypothetical protein
MGLSKFSFILNIIGCVQFVIITSIAMVLYKGGTYINPSTPYYLFWHNYFSDLGRTIAHSGIPNTNSFILFTISLSIWGFFQIPYYIVIPKFFKDSKSLKKYYLTGSLFGIFAGLFYVGIAFTPSDTTDLFHDMFVFLGFGSVFLSLIFYSVTIIKDKNYKRSYGIVHAISAVILGVYFIFLGLTPNNQTSIGLFIYVLGQKFMIYTLIICGIIQGLGAIKQLPV